MSNMSVVPAYLVLLLVAHEAVLALIAEHTREPVCRSGTYTLQIPVQINIAQHDIANRDIPQHEGAAPAWCRTAAAKRSVTCQTSALHAKPMRYVVIVRFQHVRQTIATRCQMHVKAYMHTLAACDPTLLPAAAGGKS